MRSGRSRRGSPRSQGIHPTRLRRLRCKFPRPWRGSDGFLSSACFFGEIAGHKACPKSRVIRMGGLSDRSRCRQPVPSSLTSRLRCKFPRPWRGSDDFLSSACFFGEIAGHKACPKSRVIRMGGLSDRSRCRQPVPSSLTSRLRCKFRRTVARFRRHPVVGSFLWRTDEAVALPPTTKSPGGR